MLNRLFLIFSFLLFLNSCDKEKNTARHIQGDWDLVSYKRMENNGLSFYANATGRISFYSDAKNTATLSYQSSINYQFPSDTGFVNEIGTAELIDKGEFMFVTSTNNSSTLQLTTKYRLLTQTKTDLQLEFSDTLGRVHNLIFKKKK